MNEALISYYPDIDEGHQVSVQKLYTGGFIYYMKLPHLAKVDDLERKSFYRVLSRIYNQRGLRPFQVE
jgi:hypothetical protein